MLACFLGIARERGRGRGRREREKEGGERERERRIREEKEKEGRKEGRKKNHHCKGLGTVENIVVARLEDSNIND